MKKFAAVAAVAAMLTALAPVAQAGALSNNVSRRVVIVLGPQPAANLTHASASRVEADVAALQRPILAQLHATAARHVASIPLIDSVSATVSPAEEARLQADPAVREVLPDQLVPMAPLAAPDSPATSAAKVPAGACPTTAKGVQLDPEAVEQIHDDSPSGKGDVARALGYTGAGVRVGIVAGGIDVTNPDYIRPDGKRVIADYRDFSNTGTGGNQGGASLESFLDASSVAAQGRVVINLSKAMGTPVPCRIRIVGAAPGATLDVMDVFGSAEDAYSSTILQAGDWAVMHDHVDILNESLGFNPYPDSAAYDLGEQFNDAAVKRGVTVVVAAGDAGPTNTIGSPATDPAVIDVGATTSYRAFAQLGFPGVPGVPEKGWLGDNISQLSSGGVDQAGRTLDAVAPGELNWVDCSPATHQFPGCTGASGQPTDVNLSGGTSEAAPLTSGVAALVIQAYRAGHGGTAPTPAVVKRIITSTAQDVAAPGDLQGAGLVDAYAAVLAARSYAKSAGAGAGAGHAVLDSATQLDAAGAPGTAEALTETLTNDGSSTATVDLTSRTLAPWQTLEQKALNLGSGNHYLDIEHFEVAAGAARLDTQIAYTTPNVASTTGSPAEVILFSPAHQLADDSLPQGNGAHGAAAVADPAPGLWTAVIIGGAPTTVHFLARTARWAQMGTVTPATMTLAPGASGKVTLATSLPAAPGDEAGSLVVRNATPGVPAFAAHTTVPVVLRSFAPTPAPTSSFTGNVTGGNGRELSTGQTAYYEFTVPAGQPDLGADITLPSPADTALGVLVGPNGLAASAASNSQLTDSAQGPRLTWEGGLQLHTLRPAAGTWTLVVSFYNRVSGQAVSQPYTVHLSTAPAPVSAATLPDSPGVTLPSGRATTVDVQVTNSGSSPEEYFVDARRPGTTTVPLVPLTTANPPIPPDGKTFASYLVPSHAIAVTATAVGSRPVVADFNYGLGDPDILDQPSSPSKTASLTWTVPGGGDIPSGSWIVSPEYAGPDGVNGYPKGRVHTTMTATIAPFDPAVTSRTGDLWESAVHPAEASTPVTVEPGETVTIPVTITPTGAAGTVVSGTLYLDAYTPVNGFVVTLNPGTFPFANEVAGLPYSYTVGG